MGIIFSGNNQSIINPMNAVSTIGGLVLGAANLGLSIRENQRLERLDAENMAFAREHFAYEKQLQQQLFDREDSAIQRRVADLKAAGLSPFLAAGGEGANAGAAVSTEAIQHNMDRHDNPITALSEAMLTMVSVQQAAANIAKTKADAENVQLNNRLLTKDLNNRDKYDDLTNKLMYDRLEEEVKSLKNSNDLHDHEKEKLIEEVNHIKAALKGLQQANDEAEYDFNAKKHDIQILKDLEESSGFKVPYGAGYSGSNGISQGLGVISNTVKKISEGLQKSEKEGKSQKIRDGIRKRRGTYEPKVKSNGHSGSGRSW